MAGRSGVGRRTAVALVAHMHNIQLFTPKVSRGYGLKQFRTDLKSVSERDAMHRSLLSLHAKRPIQLNDSSKYRNKHS